MRGRQMRTRKYCSAQPYLDYIGVPERERKNMTRVDGVECTAYFRGWDGLGTCDTRCQWFMGVAKCPCGKGTEAWDGQGCDMKEERE